MPKTEHLHSTGYCVEVIKDRIRRQYNDPHISPSLHRTAAFWQAPERLGQINEPIRKTCGNQHVISGDKRGDLVQIVQRFE